MKILKIAILISFLFNSVAYPYENASNTLRLPMMSGDKTNKDRLESARKLASVETSTGWEETNEAIKQRFTSAGERKEALQVVRTLARKLAENKINPFYTLRDAIPSIVPILRNPEDMQTICDMLFRFNTKIIENKLEVYGALVEAIPSAARAAKNIDELELFLNLGIKLAENKIDPIDTLYHAIPAAAKVAKTGQELKDMCDTLLNINIKLTEKKIDLASTLNYAIPVVAEVAKTCQELKDMCDALLKLNIRLDENKMDPRYILRDAIPAAAKTAKSIDELKLFVNLGIKLAETGEEITSKAFEDSIKQSLKLASGHNVKGEFSLRNYRPGWTFAGWGDAKKAIKQRFTSTKERKEALQVVRTLARKLAENKIYPNAALEYAIPAVAEAAKTPQELKDICDTLFNLNIKLAENKVDSNAILEYAIPAAAKIAKNPQELKDICDTLFDLNIKLAENKVDPNVTLKYTIPAAAKAAKTSQELKDICDILFNVEIKIAEAKEEMNPFSSLRYAIAAAAKAAKTPQELKDICDILFNFSRKLAENKVDPYYILQDAIPGLVKLASNIHEFELFINLGIKLAENKINPYYTLQYAIPAVAKVAKTPQELEDMCDTLFNLDVKLAENKINPHDILFKGIPEAAKAAKTTQELKGMSDTLLNLSIKLAENKISPESTGKLASGHNIKAEFSLRDYRPGWTFAGWEATKEAIKQRFISTEKRKEALQLVRTLVRKLAENKISHKDTLEYAIPALAKLARDMDEFALFVNLGIKLTENKIDPDETLQYAIPAAAKAAKTMQERTDLCYALFNLNITLDKNDMPPGDVLEFAIPAVAKLAKNMDDLEFFVNLGIKLAENEIHPGNILQYAIPAAAEVAKTPQKLKDICYALFNLNIKLVKNKINPANTLKYAIQAVVKIASNADELEFLINLGIKLAENKIDPHDTLRHAIPMAAKVAENTEELILFVNLGIKLIENKIYPGNTLEYAIPAVAKVAKTPQELRGICDTLFNLNMLAKNKEINSAYLDNLIDKSLEVAGNSFEDLQEFFNDVIPKMASKMKEARVLKFIKAEHIRKALKLQRKYGDFKITYKHGYDPGAGYVFSGGTIDRPPSESYEIKILPPDSTGTKLASGHNIKAEFSLRDYRPGWTFEGWGAAKDAIKQSFASTKERKEVLQIVRTLAIKLAENKINPYYVLRDDIKAAVKVTKTPQELKDVCDTLLNLNIKLAENKINPYDILCKAIPLAAEAAKNTEELKLFMNLGIKLAENRIDPNETLQYAIQAAAKAAKTDQELKDMYDTLFDLSMLVKNKGIDSESFYSLMVQSLEAAGNDFKNFKKVCSNIIPKMASKVKEARALNFITAEHIREAVELQRKYGDFGVVYDYKPKITYKKSGLGWSLTTTDQPASCEIQILPSDTAATKLASGHNIKAEFSLRDYRPGWTFEGWGAAKDAIKQSFASTKERKEALQLVRTLAKKLTENKIESYYTLRYTIPAAAKVAKTTQELKGVCDTLLNLNIKLAENNTYSYYTLQWVIPAAAKVARNMDELEIFINFAMKYAENQIYLGDTLEDVIPLTAKVAKNTQELQDICDILFNLSVLAKNKEISSAAFYNLIVQSLEVTRGSFKNFKEVCNDVIPKMIAKVKQTRALNFVKAEHVRRAVELKREYGDFKITYNYKYVPGNIMGINSLNYRFDAGKIERPSSESCQIQILPTDSTARKLASGNAFASLSQSL